MENKQNVEIEVFSFVSSKNEEIMNAIFENTKNTLITYSELKSFVAAKVLEVIGDEIKKIKEKDQEDLTARQKHLLSLPFDKLVRHFVGENIQGKIAIKDKIYDSKIIFKSQDEISNALLNFKNGEYSIKDKAPDSKYFLKKMKATKNKINSDNGFISFVSGSIFSHFKTEDEFSLIFSEQLILASKTGSINGILYKKREGLFLESLAFGQFSDALVSARINSRSHELINPIDEKLKEIIKKEENSKIEIKRRLKK